MVKKGVFLALVTILSGCAGGDNMAFPLLRDADQARYFLSCSSEPNIPESGEYYYYAMSLCLRQGESQRAALGFAVAGISTWRTAAQEGTDSARTKHQIFFNFARQKLSPTESLLLDRQLNHMAADDHEWRNLCHAVRLLEPKENAPVMFADGMRSLWEEGVRQYLRCQPS